MAYKDIGRSLEIVRAQTIITKTFNDILERRANYMCTGLILLGISLIIIILELVLTFKKKRFQKKLLLKLKDVNKKLNKTISSEKEVRTQLKEKNEELQNELKYHNSNFINVYLLVSKYIADEKKYKKDIYNLLIAGKANNAKRALKSSTLNDEYLHSFYKQFDVAFLALHPDFVERFNKLLCPEKRITPPSPDSLTIELRIYALVSLGITNSIKIADFLHYSPQTIYNYRLKIRHSSHIAEKDFPDTIANMYYQ